MRSIDLAEGFALFIRPLQCPRLARQLILTATEQLAALGVEVVEVAFEDEAVNVRERLRAALAAADADTEAPIPVELPAPVQPLAVAEPPAGYAVGAKRAVFVTGLENGIPYDQPNADYAVTAVALCARSAWRSGVFEFETGEAALCMAFAQAIDYDQSLPELVGLTAQ